VKKKLEAVGIAILAMVYFGAVAYVYALGG
jgi:hypothetical protein